MRELVQLNMKVPLRTSNNMSDGLGVDGVVIFLKLVPFVGLLKRNPSILGVQVVFYRVAHISSSQTSSGSQESGRSCLIVGYVHPLRTAMRVQTMELCSPDARVGGLGFKTRKLREKHRLT